MLELNISPLIFVIRLNIQYNSPNKDTTDEMFFGIELQACQLTQDGFPLVLNHIHNYHL